MVVLVGVVLVWRLARTGPVRGRGRHLAGWIVVGWGAFQVVDVLVFHFALGLHRLREGPDALRYDLGWLAISVVLIAAGLALALRSRRFGVAEAGESEGSRSRGTRTGRQA